MSILRNLLFGVDALASAVIGLALFLFPHLIGDYVFVSPFNIFADVK